MIKTERELLRSLATKSTQVVAWYPHAEEVRGPFGRWLFCSEVEARYSSFVASPEDDCRFAASAMNSLIPLLDYIDKLEAELKSLRKPEEGIT